jgi:peptide subunit release factor RF-3
MVLDAARGTEEQTRKLFEVYRLRDVPIITFANKLDREGRDPFDMLDRMEQSLALDLTPASWPIGMERDFLGTYDLFADALLLLERGLHDLVVNAGPLQCRFLAGSCRRHQFLPRRIANRSARTYHEPRNNTCHAEG